jgi:hypothetical protein
MSKMEKGYFNAFGDETDIKKSDIVSAYMCSNGPIYETNKVMEPNVFTCVPGILFIDKNYSTLLFALSEANMLSSLANPDADVTLFATSNEGLEEYGIRYNETSATIEFRSPADGKWNSMKSQDLNYFAQDQIYKGRLSDFSGDGDFVEMTSKNFIRFGENQVEAGENQALGTAGNVLEVVENERNGFLVKIDKPIETRYVMGQYLTNDPDISEFVKLLTSARLLDVRFRDPITKEVIPNLKFLSSEDYWTAIIPTNEAMAKARAEGIIPETYPTSTEGKDSINSFIYYHFIKEDVVFDDGKESGTFKTNLSYKDEDGITTLYKPLIINNQRNNLTFKDISGQEVKLDHANANILVRKGVVHKINSVLKYYE